ncbi:MAG: hypothetical protein RL220_255 [Bacteroidota bacterium]
MKNIPPLRLAYAVIALLILGGLCYVFRTVIAYIVISVVIGFIGDPLVSLLRRVRIGRFILPSWLCAMLTLFAFLGLIAGLFWIVAPVMAQEVNFLLSMDTVQISMSVEDKLGGISEWLNNLGWELDLAALMDTSIRKVQDMLSFENLQTALSGFIGFLSSFFAGVFSVLFISFFFLKDGSLFYKMVFTLTPDKYMDNVKSILQKSHRLLTRYFAGLFIQSLLMMLMLGIGLSVFGVKNAIIIAVFGGLVNVIPYLGPILAIVFSLFIGLTTGLSLDPGISLTTLALKITAVHIVALSLDAFLVQPLVLGSSVKAHPLEIFLVILAAGTVGGVVGMILALPVYTILRIVAGEFFTQFKVVESLTRGMNEGPTPKS